MQSSFSFSTTRFTLSFLGEVNVRAMEVVPICGTYSLSTSRPNSTSRVEMPATSNMPVPQANPIAAVTHSPAAVVSPRIMFFWKIIVPAPRKPMPDTT